MHSARASAHSGCPQLGLWPHQGTTSAVEQRCRRIPAASPRLFPCPAVLQDLGRGVLCDRLRACRSSPGWCDERGMRDWPSYLPLLPDARGGWFSESLMAGKGAAVTASRSGLPAGDGGNATLSSSSVAPSWPGVRPLRPRAGEPCLGICRERSPETLDVGCYRAVQACERAPPHLQKSGKPAVFSRAALRSLPDNAASGA